MRGRRSISIIHFGPGKVGQAFIGFFFEQKKILERQFRCRLRFRAVISSESWVRARTSSLTKDGIDAALHQIDTPRPTAAEVVSFLKHTSIKDASILIDTTASDKMLPHYFSILENGGWVVTSNKKNITLSLASYKKLIKTGRFYFETTAGAGLPVISILQELANTGDTLQEVQGCFSGTLGYIFSEMDNGVSFSKAVLRAKEQGFTEPDPRDDLSGTDVARKGLILHRTIGGNLELNRVKAQSLFSKRFARLSVVDFIKALPEMDKEYAMRMKMAKKQGKTLRYVATVRPATVSVGLKEVDQSSDIGSLRGPDNIVVIKTQRYYTNPMVIKGPGAGIEVTAAGLLGDVIKIFKK